MVAACAVVYPQHLQKLIYPDSMNIYGIYSVKLFLDNCWKYVVVDEYIPFNGEKPAFAHSPDNNEVWILILQKAFAKIVGGYVHLENLSIRDVFKMLTGDDAQEL